jgi:hypothetical protein
LPVTIPSLGATGKVLIRNGKLWSSCGCYYLATFCPCSRCTGTIECDDGDACIGLAHGIGDVMIVSHPDSEDDVSCKYAKDYSLTIDGYSYDLSDICHQLVILKGPFATYAEAEYVLDAWNDFILAYARTCACTNSCEGDELAYGRENLDGPAYFDPSGDAGVTPAPDACQTAYTWYRWTVEVGPGEIEAEFWVVDPVNGAELIDSVSTTGAITSKTIRGIIKPCGDAYLMIRVGSGGGASFAVSGDYGYLGEESPCVIEDPASPYYEDPWDYVPSTKTGVPANSDELAHFLGP